MRKILIVEDEESLRDAYQIILKTQPYIVDVASDGQEALDKCQDETYDLILLDLMMPNVNGIGFLERFDSINHESTKIVVLSNLSDTANLDKAMALGASKAVLKADLSPKQLIATVRYELEA